MSHFSGFLFSFAFELCSISFFLSRFPTDLSLSTNFQKLFEILAFRRSFILLCGTCTSCARGFDLEKKDNKTVNTAKKTHQQPKKDTREISGFCFYQRVIFWLFFVDRRIGTRFVRIFFWEIDRRRRDWNVKKHSWKQTAVIAGCSHYMEPEFGGQKIKFVIGGVNGDFFLRVLKISKR